MLSFGSTFFSQQCVWRAETIDNLECKCYHSFMNENYMLIALELAKKAMKKGEVPVGAVIVKNGKIIAKGFNKKEHSHMATRHAEIEAIEKASKKQKDWRLNDCEMYVTLEPCCMCTGAILSSRLKKVYIGAMEQNFGCCGSAYNLLESEKFTTHTQVETGIMEKESILLLQQFFKEKRKKIGEKHD